jgi:hypothetical protein
VTWWVPSERVTVPSGPVIPAPAEGVAPDATVSGGQMGAQLEPQTIMVGLSALNAYRVRPDELTSTGPIAVWPIPTVVPLAPLPPPAAAELHAAAISAKTPSAADTPRRRDRLGSKSRSRVISRKYDEGGARDWSLRAVSCLPCEEPGRGRSP